LKISQGNYRNCINKTQAEWYKKKLSESENKSKESWNIINQHRGTKKKKKKYLSEYKWEKLKDPQTVCNSFNNYFIEIASEIEQSLNKANRTYQNQIEINTEFTNFKTINEKTLEGEFRHFSSKTSCGVDSICLKGVWPRANSRGGEQ
jgi:hypothetical protein